LGPTKDFKNGICCFSCLNAQHSRVAQRIKKQSVDYTSVKEKINQFWRYKTLAVIKRHKNLLFLSLIKLIGAKIWNLIPDQIRSYSFQKLKKEYRKILIIIQYLYIK